MVKQEEKWRVPFMTMLNRTDIKQICVVKYSCIFNDNY